MKEFDIWEHSHELNCEEKSSSFSIDHLPLTLRNPSELEASRLKAHFHKVVKSFPLIMNLFSCPTQFFSTTSLFRSFIPDKNMVFCPEQLLRVILAHIHYMPDHWQGNAHRYETRDQFSQLFQYKAVSMITELGRNVKTQNHCKGINTSGLLLLCKYQPAEEEQFK